MTKILVCCTGSVASIKIPYLIPALLKEIVGCEMRLIFTEKSKAFFDPEVVKTQNNIEIFNDNEEWKDWSENTSVLHIELRKWADIMLIAPLDANTLAKIACGLCDNLLTCIVRSWKIPANQTIIVCPAMNTQMWNHPITAEHINKLESWGFDVIQPISKRLACGDEGIGAMAEVVDIVNYLTLKKL